MTPQDAELAQWITRTALRDDRRERLLEAYCDRLWALGIPLWRMHVTQSALHPVFGGLGYSWVRGIEMEMEEYAATVSPTENWLKSPLYHLLDADLEEIRIKGTDAAACARFPVVENLKAQGATDYFAMRVLMEDVADTSGINPNAPPAGALFSWTSDAAEGFSPAQITTLRDTMPFLGLALKAGANRRTLQDLMQVYLGEGPGARVLSGEIRRGTLERTRAAILLFDLTGFTRMTAEVPAQDVIRLLNDYFGLLAELIEARGGYVLKFMGDGVLAIFNSGDARTDARAALDVARALNHEIPRLNEARQARGEYITEFTLALHSGDVLYGNIGAENRLDFTVIGTAVNLTARISGMHRALGQAVVLSDALRDAAGAEASDVVGLGRYMLRGIPDPQSLYTLHP